MREQDGIDRILRYRELGAIALAQLFVALGQAAVDEDASPGEIDHVPRAGHGAGGSEKLQGRCGSNRHV